MARRARCCSHGSKMSVEHRRLKAARAFVAAFEPRTGEQQQAKRLLTAVVGLLASKIRAGHTVGYYWDLFGLCRDLAEHGEARSRSGLRLLAARPDLSGVARVELRRRAPGGLMSELERRGRCEEKP